jgi:hypothetical protein
MDKRTRLAPVCRTRSRNPYVSARSRSSNVICQSAPTAATSQSGKAARRRASETHSNAGLKILGTRSAGTRTEAWLRSAWAIAGVGPLDAIAAAMGHVEECDR